MVTRQKEFSSLRRGSLFALIRLSTDWMKPPHFIGVNQLTWSSNLNTKHIQNHCQDNIQNTVHAKQYLSTLWPVMPTQSISCHSREKNIHQLAISSKQWSSKHRSSLKHCASQLSLCTNDVLRDWDAVPDRSNLREEEFMWTLTVPGDFSSS